MHALCGPAPIGGHKTCYGRSVGLSSDDRGTPAVRGAGLRLVEPSRDQQILALRAEGFTLAEIGRRFGLSRQRVEQIIRAAGGAEVERELTRARRDREVEARRVRQEGLADERAGEILDRYRQGADPQQIARDLGLQHKVVKALIGRRRTDGDRSVRSKALSDHVGRPRFSDLELRDGMRLAAGRMGHTPTTVEYDRLAHDLGLASTATVYMRFGSWGSALRAAGLEPNATSAIRSPKWHIAACWRALVSVADQLGDPPRYGRYAELAATREDLPSAATLRQRLGLWSEITAALAAYQKASTSGRAAA